jgi:hypothetical protein
MTLKHIIFICILVLGAPALLWAQQQPTPPAYPTPQDALLVDLFKDEVQSGAAQPTTSTPSLPPQEPSIQNLPGTPSPVTNPASPGEAVIERAPGGNPNTMEAQNAPPPPRKKKVVLTPAQAAWASHSKAWIPRNPGSVRGCYQSYTPYRPLYHIRCVQLMTGKWVDHYVANPNVYKLTPPIEY